jgi:hypothetical protein
VIILIVAVVIGSGLALFKSGRSAGSLMKTAFGSIAVVLGLGLLALQIIVEAKKAGVI